MAATRKSSQKITTLSTDPSAIEHYYNLDLDAGGFEYNSDVQYNLKSAPSLETPEEPDYTITVASGIENGSVTTTPSGSAKAGTQVTITATPADNYEIDIVTVTDADSNHITVINGKFTMPPKDVTVSATFKVIRRTITIARGISNGSVTTTPSGSADVGTQVTITATPADDYEIDAITVTDSDGQPVTVTDGKFTMPPKGVTVNVTFKAIIHTITIESGIENGSVTTTPSESATAGTQVTITATPADDYEIDAITVTDSEGQPVTVTDGKFTMPPKDVTVSATFKAILYVITIESGIENGSVTTTPSESATAGTQVTITATPADDYEIDAITVTDSEGQPVTVTDGKFTMPSKDVTVSAKFKAIIHTITIASGISNGNVTTTPSGSATAGTQVTITATPADDYEIDAITVTDSDGQPVTVTNGKFTMPPKDVTVNVTFKEIPAGKPVEPDKPVNPDDPNNKGDGINMSEYYCYQGLRNGGTFKVDETTAAAIANNPMQLIGKVVTLTGDFTIGYGSSGDRPLGFVEQVELEGYGDPETLIYVVSVVWNQSKEDILCSGAETGGQYVGCDGNGGVSVSSNPTSAVSWGIVDAENQLCAVYIHG